MHGNTQYKVLKSIMIMGIGVISAFAAIDRNTYAETSQPYRYSSKCNEFTFDATKSRFPEDSNISFLWDFGDGTTSIEPVVTHTYAQSGDYTVNLSVTDKCGFECNTAMTSQTVRVNILPKVTLTSEDRGCVHKPVILEAQTSPTDTGKKLRYVWNFGDGSRFEGDEYVEKAYSKGGGYRVILTVDDHSETACGRKTVEKLIHINEPPAAQAGDGVILRCVRGPEDMTIDFDASATTDMNNDPLSYIWDFGDGYIEKGREVSHRYNRTGNYDVKLIVSDNTNLRCGTDVDFVSVKLNRALRADAGEDIVACAGEDIRFDGSNSYIHKEGTAVAQWVFGDGTSSSVLNAVHRYNRPGVYQATLSLENKLNGTCPVSRDTRMVKVNAPPFVNIQSSASACAGKKVFFDASSAADPDSDELEYHWNFGDGTISKRGAKVSHNYIQGGNYHVRVIVDDKKGTSCSTVTAHANVRINTPPIADAGPNLSCCVDERTTFTASTSSDPDGDPLTYTWDFGDGFKTQGETITHTYTQQGSYNVLLTVDDHTGGSCSQSTDSFIAVVREKPVPVITLR